MKLNKRVFLSTVIYFCIFGLLVVYSSCEGNRKGNSVAEGWDELKFKIVRIHEQRSPLNQPPWHGLGGNWTVIEAEIQEQPVISFIFGFQEKKSTSPNKQIPFSLGEAFIAVNEREHGMRFLDTFGKAFYSKPPQLKYQHVLQLISFNTAILGRNLKALPDGGFGGTGGGWTTLKLFPSFRGIEAEIYLNINLKDKEGFFSEKDPEYRQDLMVLLAVALRDGPQPPRSPASDINLTDKGPCFGKWLELSSNASYYSFLQIESKVLIGEKVDRLTKVWLIDISSPKERQLIAEVKGSLMKIEMIDKQGKYFLLDELIPSSSQYFSSDDPHNFHLINLQKAEDKIIAGSLKDFHPMLADPAISPDGKYLTFRIWKSNSVNKQRHSEIIFFEIERNKQFVFSKGDTSMELVSWINGSKTPQPLVLAGSRWDTKNQGQFFLADLFTNQLTPAPKGAENYHSLSPDKKQCFSVFERKLTIEDIQTGIKRTFIIHPDDERYVENEDAIKWVNSNYLFFQTYRSSFVNIQTLKMNYPLTESEEKDITVHYFSPEFKWVMATRDRSLLVAPIIISKK